MVGPVRGTARVRSWLILDLLQDEDQLSGLRHQSARRSPRRPRRLCPDSERCSLASCAQARAERPEGFAFVGRSTKLWSCASCGCRRIPTRGRHLPPSDGRSGRTTSSTGGAIPPRGCGIGNPSIEVGISDPSVDGLASRLGHLELNRSPRLLLHHDCAGCYLAAMRDVRYPKLNQIARA